MAKVAKNGYPDMITTGDILTADVLLGQPGTWIEIGSYQVPRGTAKELGLGRLSGQDNARGRLYIDIVDDSAGSEDGILRICAVNPTGTREVILWQGSTIAARGGDADTRAAQIPFPETDYIIPEDWFIKVKMNPAVAADTVDVSACTFLMDCLTYDYS